MRWLIRVPCQLIAHPAIAIVIIVGACLAAYNQRLSAGLAAITVILYAMLFSAARRWLDVDAVTLDPYRRRRKRRGKSARKGRAGQGTAPLTLTRVEIAAKGHRKAPRQAFPELVSRLPASLNRMVMEGLLDLQAARSPPRPKEALQTPSFGESDPKTLEAADKAVPPPSKPASRPSAPKVPRRRKAAPPDAA